MSHAEIVRAWRDPEYRSRLGKAERERLPQHPAGLIELAEVDLEAVAGGALDQLPLTSTDSLTASCTYA